MSIAPINFYASFNLVPVFEWITCKAEDEDKNGSSETSDAAVTAAAGSPPSDPATDDGNEPRKRLVCVGWQWRPGISVATWPRPAWMDGITAGLNDPASTPKHDDDADRRAGDVVRARRLAMAHLQPAAHPAPGTGPTDTQPAPAAPSAETDTSGD